VRPSKANGVESLNPIFCQFAFLALGTLCTDAWGQLLMAMSQLHPMLPPAIPDSNVLFWIALANEKSQKSRTYWAFRPWLDC
jgi:hypothetical protein